MSVTDKRLDGLKPGTVVQLSPDIEVFGGCLMVVTEPREWGAQGYIYIPGRGPAYFRASWEQMTYVGMAKYDFVVDLVEHEKRSPFP